MPSVTPASSALQSGTPGPYLLYPDLCLTTRWHNWHCSQLWTPCVGRHRRLVHRHPVSPVVRWLACWSALKRKGKSEVLTSWQHLLTRILTWTYNSSMHCRLLVCWNYWIFDWFILACIWSLAEFGGYLVTDNSDNKTCKRFINNAIN